MNESLTIYANPHNGNFKQLQWVELEIPSMCSEFDPNDGDTWTKVTYIDTSTGTAKFNVETEEGISHLRYIKQ